MNGVLELGKQRNVEEKNYLYQDFTECLTIFSIPEILCGSDRYENERISR